MERYSSAYRKEPGGGNITELGRTDVPLNNPVSNQLDTDVQPLRDDMNEARADWRAWNVLPPGQKATHLRYRGALYLRTNLTPKDVDALEKHLDRGKNWETWNLDPRDSLAIYNDLVDING